MCADGILSLVFSGIVAISTICYVLLTRQLVKESRETRKFYITPSIVASLQFAETSRNVIQLKLKNIGLGYAQNVSFQIFKDFEWVKGQPLKERGVFKKGIQSFPPNYELIYTLVILEPEKDEPLSDNDYIEFIINYQNIHKNTYSNPYKLKFNEIFDQGYAKPPLDNESAKVYYMSEILKQLVKMNKEAASPD
jgi:hypothetical protein